ENRRGEQRCEQRQAIEGAIAEAIGEPAALAAEGGQWSCRTLSGQAARLWTAEDTRGQGRPRVSAPASFRQPEGLRCRSWRSSPCPPPARPWEAGRTGDRDRTPDPGRWRR